ncbi:component of the polarisome [Coniosporium tulheliwenetii]|uniref:Component of the polarisome n=1 Tax=Coniosporium tulheliwenetii TaxID=3383036 RepID=A0ACC2YLN3_9PEZI|nr:component of the polarisome [Cladosporium sp. JES 115]
MGPLSSANTNPSPPASVARSSDATGRYAPSVADSRASSSKNKLIQEETLSEHYQVLKQYLAPYLRDEKGNPRPNRARDKLLRLSAVQFQELSTDVYDESIRREEQRRERANRPIGAPETQGQTPSHLLPIPKFHPKRNQARQKLSTLPLERFRQLATDVFFELERRFPRFAGGEPSRAPSPAPSTASSNRSAPRANGGPPPGWRGPRPGAGTGAVPPPQQYRNGPSQSPGVPGSLAIGEGTGQGGGNVYGRPLPKTFQSNTIVPNKSTMVEDDDSVSGVDEEDDARSEAFGLETDGQRNSELATLSQEKEKEIMELRERVAGLEGKVGSLETTLKDKDEEVERLTTQGKNQESASDAEKEQWMSLQRGLESKLEEAQNLNASLRSEIEKLRSESSTTERDLRSQIEEARRTAIPAPAPPAPPPPMEGNWQKRYLELERELFEQQQVTEDVRREASQFLTEMRALSERSDAALEKEEKLQHKANSLEEELQQWKSRYAKAKTQLRTLRASSMGLSLQNPTSSLYVRDGSLMGINGLVKDVHVTKFQLSIDELLQAARQANAQAVLDCMKTIVICVRNITSDVDAADSSRSSMDSTETPRSHTKLKARVSATANNLITASKNHAAASGLSPVSLLDAAASHLATAVIELVRAVKIRPTPAEELNHDDNDQGEEGYFSLANGISHLREASTTSAGSSAAGYSTNRSSVELGSAAVAPVSNGCLSISTATHDATSSSHIAGPERAALERHALPVVNVLEDCRMQLMDVEDVDAVLPITFRVSRAVTELGKRVERVLRGG